MCKLPLFSYEVFKIDGTRETKLTSTPIGDKELSPIIGTDNLGLKEFHSGHLALFDNMGKEKKLKRNPYFPQLLGNVVVAKEEMFA